MSILNALNEMRLDNVTQNLITFRTSRAERFIGLMFVLLGFSMLCYLFVSYGYITNEYPNLCVFCLISALFFEAMGLALLSIKKYVVVDNALGYIEIEERYFCFGRTVNVSFSDVAKLELSKCCHKIFASKTGCWVVKAYIRHPGSELIVEDLFHSKSYADAVDVIDQISYMCKCEVYKAVDIALPKMSFTY